MADAVVRQALIAHGREYSVIGASLTTLLLRAGLIALLSLQFGLAGRRVRCACGGGDHACPGARLRRGPCWNVAPGRAPHRAAAHLCPRRICPALAAGRSTGIARPHRRSDRVPLVGEVSCACSRGARSVSCGTRSVCARARRSRLRRNSSGHLSLQHRWFDRDRPVKKTATRPRWRCSDRLDAVPPRAGLRARGRRGRLRVPKAHSELPC